MINFLQCSKAVCLVCRGLLLCHFVSAIVTVCCTASIRVCFCVISLGTHISSDHFDTSHFQVRRWVDLAYSCGVLLYLMGWRIILLFLCHCFFMFIISFTQSLIIVWVTSLGLLMTLNIDYTYSLMVIYTMYM